MTSQNKMVAVYLGDKRKICMGEYWKNILNNNISAKKEDIKL